MLDRLRARLGAAVGWLVALGSLLDFLGKKDGWTDARAERPLRPAGAMQGSREAAESVTKVAPPRSAA
ncbi:hypothetical protein [Benzoatithermus flavus]|uniref:Uncharacterized protein n=1 Tax=Benzoatithermus flavus TaxID=3108223 RepID=A0ABU8XNN1_9PROT